MMLEHWMPKEFSLFVAPIFEEKRFSGKDVLTSHPRRQHFAHGVIGTVFTFCVALDLLIWGRWRLYLVFLNGLDGSEVKEERLCPPAMEAELMFKQ